MNRDRPTDEETDMAETPAGPPKKIMLATDLSGRGDRALDRATGLAHAWGAELLVVHALGEGELAEANGLLPSWRRAPDFAARVEQQIRDDIRGPCPALRFHIEEGSPLTVILEAARREHPDLLVVAMGRSGAMGGLSRTVDELFRQSPCSMLVVKKRPHGAYGHILVGTDYTTEARRGLEVATRLFPSAAVVVMHAYEMPYRNLYLDISLAERFGGVEQETMANWLAQAEISDDARARTTFLIEHGPPEVMLDAYVTERGADLTVIGAYERSRLFHLMVGGMGPRIVQSVSSDLLVVRAGPPAG